MNGRVIDFKHASVPAISAATFYGKGVFTTIAIDGGRPLLWPKHWSRLLTDAASVGIDFSQHNEEHTRIALDEIIAANAVTSGRARITLLAESSGPIWTASGETKADMIITTGDPRPVHKPFLLTIAPFTVNSRSPLGGIKSCNYLDKILALDEARSRGFHEAVMLNERGEVASAVMANLFWVANDQLYTPSLKTGCLAGTTREFVLENVECREVEQGIEAVNEADAIFLTSAGLGIVMAAKFDSKPLVDLLKHPILALWPPH